MNILIFKKKERKNIFTKKKNTFKNKLKLNFFMLLKKLKKN